MGISGQLFLKVQNSNPIERWLELSISLEQESRIVIIIKSGHHPILINLIVMDLQVS